MDRPKTATHSGLNFTVCSSPLISMTWPQYLRRECDYKDWRTPLTAQETEVLLVMLVRGRAPSPVKLLCEAVWGNDPDGGPEGADAAVRGLILRLRAKLPGAIAGAPQFGWYLDQFQPETKNHGKPYRYGRRHHHDYRQAASAANPGTGDRQLHA